METFYIILIWPLFKDLHDTFLLEFNVRKHFPPDELIWFYPTIWTQ